MSLKRRLLNLENRPFRRPVARRDDRWILPPEECRLARQLQRKMCLPIPSQSTDDERSEISRLMVAARDKLRADHSDTSGVDAVRDYSIALHTKYGTDPTWGENQGDN